MDLKTKIKTIARQTLAIEMATLEALLASIDDDFCACVEAIYESPGRLIVSGVGKSALVAQKVAATLNSTGTPAIFMHAADAVHGDIGMIRTGDMVLCISKSGDTAEIKVLLPFLRQLGYPIIGMVSQRQSFLGRQAEYVLHTPISQEADPNNLAPTASTTAQMAMGDALATALLALRGFSPADFAQFHPGGMLGKQLYLRVKDLYPNNAKPHVLPNASIRDTIIEMTSKSLGATAVIAPSGELIGIITDGDLRRMLKRGGRIDQLTAYDIMTHAPKTIQSDELAVSALEKMRALSITQLIVTDKQQIYLGFVHLHDLIREGLV
ncbi:MAG: KpsF/GutQ family sugar-phosphate isomerase [Bacteroidota bacterium]